MLYLWFRHYRFIYGLATIWNNHNGQLWLFLKDAKGLISLQWKCYVILLHPGGGFFNKTISTMCNETNVGHIGQKAVKIHVRREWRHTVIQNQQQYNTKLKYDFGVWSVFKNGISCQINSIHSQVLKHANSYWNISLVSDETRKLHITQHVVVATKALT